MENSIYPKVSIGIPVYNGEDFLEAAIDSVLGQTFEDFELIISDNASTDRTREICEAYQQKDERVCYYRHEENLGAARNFNFTAQKAKAEYFAWLAHDDVMGATYIEKCINKLDTDSSVVLCFAQTVFIDENGNFLKNNEYKQRVEHADKMVRFFDMVSSLHIVTEVFGLMRTHVLRQTPMIASYMTSDLVLLGELLLHGRFYQLEEQLFFHREHFGRSVKSHADPRDRELWFDSRKKINRVFPLWRRLTEHAHSIIRVPMKNSDRLKLFTSIVKVAYWRWKLLLKEVVSAL